MKDTSTRKPEMVGKLTMDWALASVREWLSNLFDVNVLLTQGVSVRSFAT